MKKDSFGKSILLIIFYFILQIVFSVVFVICKFDESFEEIYLLLEFLILMGLTIFVFRDALKGKLKDYIKNFKKYFPMALKYWTIGLTLMIVSNGILIAILGDIAPNEQSVRELLLTYPVYAVISTIICAPISEEILFRLSFKNVLKSKKTFIFITSLLFGLSHVIFSLSNPFYIFYMIPYALFGSALGALFWDTDNIYTSMTAHMIHNAFCIVIIFLGL